jgi:hypothetical protein
MSATYNAVTLDGKEHTGLDLFMIKQWYFSRRLRPDSFVQSPETGEWKLLKSLFNPAEWEAEEREVRGLGPNESVFKVTTSPQQLRPLPEPVVPYHYDRDNELGLRTAAILLFINAAVTLFTIAFQSWRPATGTHISVAWGFSILIDVGVGAKLLGSDNASRWKKFLLFRVSLGALLGLGLMVVGPFDSFRLIGLLQLIFTASFFLLLVGEASRARVFSGVTGFAVSICGIVGLLLFFSAAGGAMKQEILKKALTTRSYSDAESAVTMDLPYGWVMLPVDSDLAPMPEARMVAAQPDSNSYAALLIVQNHSAPDLDTVLSSVMTQKRKQDESMAELQRVNAPIGRLEGRKAVLSWQYKGKPIKGSMTVAHNGTYYVVLLEWCLAEDYEKSVSQFAALENSASVGEPRPDPFASRER